jgi:Bacterial transcriptional activator domain
MLALSRCGRQTEARAVFRQAREKLIDKAGVDPGLFAERAQAVDPAFDITSCRADMVRTCEALDGPACTCHQGALAAELLSAVTTVEEHDFVYLVLGHTSLCASNADRGDSEAAALPAQHSLARAEASSTALLQLAHWAAGWAAIRRAAYDDSAQYARAHQRMATGNGAPRWPCSTSPWQSCSASRPRPPSRRRPSRCG